MLTAAAFTSTVPVLATASAPAGAGQDAKMQSACEQFEAYFLAGLMREMRASLPKGGIFAHSQGEQIFQEQLDDTFAARMSQTQSFGLAAMMYRQLQAQAGSPAAAGEKK